MPRNKLVAQFQLNNEPNIRSMRYDDLYDYLINLLPSKSKEIYDYLIVYHKSFFLDIIKGEIKDISFDTNKEVQELKKNIRSHSMHNIGNVVKKNRKIKKNKEIKKALKNENKQIDSLFKILSKSETPLIKFH